MNGVKSSGAFSRRTLCALVLTAVGASLTSCRTNRGNEQVAISYPTTRQTNVVDDYHGVKVADPYRWLEDDNSPETRAWVEEQNRVTSGYLRGLPGFDAIKRRLTRLWNYERYGVPFKQGDRKSVV